jgi:hypothetical protein
MGWIIHGSEFGPRSLVSLALLSEASIWDGWSKLVDWLLEGNDFFMQTRTRVCRISDSCKASPGIADSEVCINRVGRALRMGLEPRGAPLKETKAADLPGMQRGVVSAAAVTNLSWLRHVTRTLVVLSYTPADFLR